jgi:hypothetical protein
MTNTIKIRRVVEEECEIFTFPTDDDRQGFIAELKRLQKNATYATNIDPDEGAAERYLVAIPTWLYDFATKGE